MKNQILVVDSGLGGLNVLRLLQKSMPHRNFIYFADEAYCPYGEKSTECVKTRVLKIVDVFKHVACATVLACNTASVCAGDELRQAYAPLFDVVLPTAYAVKQSGAKRVAVLATKLTVQSGVYESLLAKCGVDVTSVDCGEFVGLVESNAPAGQRLEVVKSHLSDICGKVQTVALCCTHFDYLLSEIRSVVGCNANIVSSSRALAESCVNALASKEQAKSSQKGQTVYLSSKNDNVYKISQQTGLPFQPFVL